MIGRKSTNRGGPIGEAATAEMPPSIDNGNNQQEQNGGPLRRWMTSLNQAAASDPAGSTEDDLDLKPTTMRRPEPLYGYVVALELIFVSILNLAVTHGSGAPARPATTWSTVGLVASIGLIPVIRFTNHRLIVAFYTVIATFLATQPRTPNSLAITHFLALGIAIVYAFWLSRRQRKAASARVQAGRSGSGGTGASRSPRQRPANSSGSASGGRRGRRQKEAPSGPQPSRRYTPPKAKRAR